MKPSLVLIFILFLITGVSAQQIKYGTGNDSWNPDSLGNHRAVLTVSAAGNVAKATIEWRRRDTHPELKDIWVVDAKTNSRITDVKAANISREQGTIYFEPTSGAGTYYVYYMPYQVEGRSNYPNAQYRKAPTAESQWPDRKSVV